MKNWRKFEQEAFKILKQEFDEVEWLSKEHLSSFDFKCIKNKRIYYGEAKLTKNKPFLLPTQKEADFIVFRTNNKVQLIFRKDFKKYGVKTINSRPILISDELHKQLMKEAGALQNKEGKFIGVPKLIELMLLNWRKAK